MDQITKNELLHQINNENNPTLLRFYIMMYLKKYDFLIEGDKRYGYIWFLYKNNIAFINYNLVINNEFSKAVDFESFIDIINNNYNINDHISFKFESKSTFINRKLFKNFLNDTTKTIIPD